MGNRNERTYLIWGDDGGVSLFDLSTDIRWLEELIGGDPMRDDRLDWSSSKDGLPPLEKKESVPTRMSLVHSRYGQTHNTYSFVSLAGQANQCFISF